MTEDTFAFPTSFAQRRLWVLDQLAPGDPSYSLLSRLHFRARIDEDALVRSLHEIVRRHESLRTTFAVVDGEPVQVVRLEPRLPLERVDLRHLSEAERAGAADRVAVATAGRPFDLGQGPLLRVVLVRLEDDAYALFLSIHHIAADGWSLGVFFRELAEIYPALAAGRPSPLPSLPIQYSDYAVWQRETLRGETLHRLLAYWRGQLEGLPDIALPVDHPALTARSSSNAQCSFALASPLVDALQALGQREGCTLYMTLLAAFFVLLHRHTGQADLAVGTPIAGRTRVELEGLIGPFVNTLVLRVDLHGAPTVRELLGRVRRVTLDAYTHQDCPFELLVEELRPQRHVDRNPLVQVMFHLQNAPRSGTGRPVGGADLPSGSAAFDLAVDLWPAEGGMAARCEYNPGLFEAVTIDRLIERFQVLLAGIVADPDCPVSALPLLPESEAALLAAWAAPAEIRAPDACVHDLVTRQADHTPDAVALRAGGEQWTFRELQLRAADLARQLRRLGVGRGQRVGLYLPRSRSHGVAVLGVLMAGAAFVSLDAAHPPAHLAGLVRAARLRVVLAAEPDCAWTAMLSDLAVDERPLVLAVDDDAAGDSPWVGDAVDAGDLAYVVFTSGTTGAPKGIEVEHRALARRITGVQPHYRLRPADRVMHFASFSFDASIEELLAPWLAGACVVMRPDEPFASFAELHRFVVREGITVLNLPTAFWHAWVADLVRTGGAVPSCVSLVIVGSEPALPERLRSWQELAPHVRWINAYGPAEATITATLDEPGALQPVDEPVPIGRPIAGTEVRVLDESGALVPIGVPGELHLGGDALARGYLDDPGRTAAVFVPGAGASARLYRTGDRVRWRADGRLVFLGRVDQQVKVRGVRVEPGEIEAVLCRHPAVAAAAVIAREVAPAEYQLVAYVAPAAGASPDELRRFLAARLPSAMVPAVFVPLPSLPLTPGGKVDRRGLPAPAAPQPRTTAPRSPMEVTLARLWSEVLRLPEVDVDDDFFRLGGHSLLATQLISRLRDTIGVEVSLRHFFEHPTIARLAATLGEAPRAQPPSIDLRSRPRADMPGLLDPGLVDPGLLDPARSTTAPLSFAQQRLWFLHQLSPASPFYNIPVGLRLTRPLDPAVVERCLDEIVRRHEILRTTFPVVDGQPVQAIAPALHVGLTRVDLRGRADARVEVRRAVAEAARRPFDLARGPLLRACLLDEAGAAQVLLVVLHHIIADGWSIGVLLRELAALYPALAAGRPSPLPDLPVQYADFAVWQREVLQGEPLARLLAYWRRQLDGLPVLALPTDHPRPAAATFHGARRFVVYPAALTAALKALGEREGCTLFMTLLAAFFVLLHRYTGQVDLALGSAIANRTRPELEGLLGFFVNSIVLRGDLSGDPSFRELLRRIRALALDAYAHQDLPFERLVEELQPERSLARNPLVQVMFALQNAPTGALDGEGVESLEIERGTANFDLVVDLWERSDGRLGGRFEYSTDLFDAATIDRMSAHLERLLAGIVAEPERTISTLPLVTEPERRELLAWTATTAPYPAERTLVELFEEQVARAPEATAVVRGAATWSYRALDLTASRLAHHLVALGVEPGALVALYLEGSFELVACQLAVLKAGAAYVSLDLEYPPDRLAVILEQAGAHVLVSRRPLAHRLPSGVRHKVWVDDDQAQIDQAQIDAMPEQPLRRRGAPDDIAHVIYTSGSTGTPKGICIPHRAVIRLVCGTDYIDLGPGDRIAHAANPAFDAATFEIWGALLHGGTLVVIEREVMLSPRDLATVLSEQRISTLFVTTALFHHVAAAAPAAFAGLRDLLFGGEQADPRWAREVLTKGPPRRLLHVYGPTECTTFATWQLVTEVPADAATVPIGRPLANTTTYVLDGHMQLVPVGVPGELYLGGPGLALGYFQRPDLTAERFVPHRFADGRLYRTGDVVRWRPDGSLEFLYRSDAQVKIRGFRVEPGEIETMLCRHPRVREAVVVTRDTRGERRLVAYVVEDQGGARTPDASNVDDWRRVYDEVIYEGVDAHDDPTLNTTGWRSSYTGEPLSAGEMREQVEQTVARLLAVRPRRVLEIGCGTGMLLFRVAPACEAYWATDFSSAALRFVRGVLDARPLPQVTLLEAMADDLSSIEPASFDLVVLNSVIQYFPSVEYLAEVLAQAVRVLRPGGHIFCGDVRSLPLLPAFHVDVELAGAAADLRLDALRQRIQRRLAQEDELVVAPELFAALRTQLPRLGPARIWPKRGHHHNELTRFRYDALLSIDPAQAPGAWERCDWAALGSLAAVVELLDRDAPATLLIGDVPNARVAAAARAAEILGPAGGLDAGATVADLRVAAEHAAASAVDPEALWQLAASRPYEVELRCAEGDHGRLDVLLRRRDVDTPWPSARMATGGGALRDHASDPRRGRCARWLTPELRAFLLARLPEYMVPAAFVPLSALPLTPNGKLDRRALPPAEDLRDLSATTYVAPRSDLERALARLWAEVLGLHRVGVHDNFFQLGGHSLLVTQLVSRIRDTLRVEVTIRGIFEAPTVARFAASLAATPPSVDASRTPGAIERQARDGGVPLSFAQQRLWFLDQMFPGSPLYTIRAVIRLSAPLDPVILGRCLDALVRRQEVLRTSFAIRDGQPVQVIADDARVALEVIDLRTLPPPEREPAAGQRIAELAGRRFDLSRGPLLRAAVLQLADDQQVLLLVVHHIAADGWSLGVLLRDLSALYPALSQGRPSPLPELPIQYADFAIWQRRRLSGPALAPLLSYWRQRLQGLPTLRLPTDAPRPAVPSHRGRQCALALPPSLSAAVLALGRAEGCTLFMTVLAALVAVLHRDTGQTDIAVGSPIANRTRAELEGLVGFFLNTLVLRVDLAGDPSFRALMARVRDIALGAYAHQELPFELLLQELRLERDLSRTPLFQVFLNVLNFSDPNVGGAVLRARGEPDEEVVAQFDLALYAGEVDDQIVFQLIHDAELFEPATARRLLHHLQQLLGAATEQPERPLSALLASGSDVRRPRPRSSGPFERFDARAATSIPARFFDQARRDPGHVATAIGDRRCTYGELAARAAGVAAALGVRAGQRVALLLDPGASMMAAILGVLAAGAAYVPLDLSHPPARLQAILDLAEVTAILAATAHRELAVGLTRGRLPVLDVDAIPPCDPPPSLAVDPDGVAYILFTSGSSGEPKGVVQSHRNVLRHVAAYTDALEITAGDGLTLLSSYSFDAAVMDIYGALLNGATLFPIDVRRGGAEAVVDALDHLPITIYHSTPTVFRHALAGLPPGRVFPGVRLVVLGGEPVIAGDADRFRRHFVRGTVLINGLGPTESTLALQQFLDHDTPTLRPSVPVGRPVDGIEVFLLDDTGREVGHDGVGEIVIQGAQVALGYWRRPDLTHAAFSGGSDGAPRRYRTGDLGRRLSDGAIEYVGRKDAQVKIRGHRVELGEIEACLAEHPAVLQAAAAVHPDVQGELRLCAYAVLRPGAAAPSASELRRFLRLRLPDAMLPTAFHPLAALPVTTTGKLDRRALPPPPAHAAPSRDAAPPRTPAETALTRLMADLLGLETVAVDDDFFLLGGHSLLATRLVSRVRETLGVDLSLRQIFETPTPAALARAVAEAAAAPRPIAPQPRDRYRRSSE